MPDVVLPALNEAAAVEWVLRRLPDGYHAIVVDNGSTDATAEIATRHGAQVVSEPTRGFGSACFAGLSAATSDIVCFMDCDASLDPLALPLMVSYIETSVQSVWRRQVEAIAGAPATPRRSATVLNRSTPAKKGAD